MKFSRLVSITCLGLAVICCPHSVSARSNNSLQITLNSFTGIYHLSRDAKDVSLLTTEETIVTDFPGSGNFYGLTRQIPKTYQGHSVDIKILNIVDAVGNTIPYKTTSDSNGNLVITTGDPAINLYGSQTFKFNYQTKGV